MNTLIIRVFLLGCLFTNAFASETVHTLKDASGNAVITNKTPEILAVKETPNAPESYLFIFYRDEQRNDNNNNEQFIVYQYAQITENETAAPAWSKPIKIERNDFRSKQGVAAAFMNGRIYLFGKRDGVRYTSATIAQAIHNDWQSWEFLRDNKNNKVDAHGTVDAIGHPAKKGGEAITVAMQHKRADAGGNMLVSLYECKASGVKLACGEKAQPSGNDLSKQYLADSEPMVTFAADLTNPSLHAVYVVWASHERVQDNAIVDDFLYYRRLHSANERDYYGDYKASGKLRPKDFVKDNENSLYAKPALAAIEHHGFLELFRQTGENEKVTRLRFNGVDSDKSTTMTEISTLPIKAKSGVSAVSVGDKVYVVYQNVDKNVGGMNSLNYIVMD